MKSIKLYFESLLDDDDIFLDPKNDKKDIENWIKNNYKIVGKLNISDDFVVDCNGIVEIKNESIESLTNGLFKWGEINMNFYCASCNVKSLEGAPEKVGGHFDCSNCKNLKSLEGAPKKVGGYFICNYCNNLTSLKGAPKEVGGTFNCNMCNKLETLKGAPEVVRGDFYCSFCNKLKITDSDRKKYKIIY